MENNEKNPLNLRSEEIQDIMSKAPSWVIRWGITTIFAIIILGIFMTYLIQYPEIIKGPISITTEVPPVKVFAQIGGNLTKVHVVDGQKVTAGTLLAEIENPITGYGVTYLRSYIQTLETEITKGSSQLPIPDTANIAVGDLQSIVNLLHKDIFDFNLRRQYKVDDVEISSLNQRLMRERDLLAVTDRMLGLSQKDLENARIRYESDKQLYNQGVISKTEFLTQENNYRAKQLQVEQLRQTQIQSSISIGNLQQQISQFGYNKLSREQNGIESIKANLETIRSYLVGWQQKYNLIASKDGEVSFLQNLDLKQFVKPGEELFAILQPQNKYIGFASIPSNGMGKVAIGQHVYILLEHYPYYEYGMVEGKVKHIALLPNGSEYRVEIAMPNGMKSTHGEVLKFNPEMTGVAEVVTEEKRVIERIFGSFVKVINKR